MLVVGADRIKDVSTSEIIRLVVQRGCSIAFRLHDCTDSTIEFLTTAARNEGRKFGWVSEALVRVLVREFVAFQETTGLAFLLREERLPLPPTLTWHVKKNDARAIAKSLEIEHSFMAAVDNKQILQGMAIANDLALREGGILKDAVGQGYDVRSPVLQGITSKACLLTGACNPIVVSDAAFSPHTSADAFALETQQKVGTTAKKMAILFGGEVAVDAPVIVRLNPRGRPSTAVVVKVRLPGMHPVCFSWPAERPR